METKFKVGDLVFVENPGYNLRTPVGEVKYYKTLADNDIMIMIQYPGYTAVRAFYDKQCRLATYTETKQYFKDLLAYGK